MSDKSGNIEIFNFLLTLVFDLLKHNVFPDRETALIQGGAKRTDVFRNRITTLILKVKLSSM